MDKPIAYRILKPESGRSPESKTKFGKAYVNGNIVEGNEAVTANNWAGGVQPDDKPDAGALLDSIRSDKPFSMANVTTITAKEAYDYVLANAGAALPKRDAVDERIIRVVKSGKIEYNANADQYAGDQFLKRRLPADSYKQGIISNINQVGGYPEYKGTPYKDSDKDGIPDAWERLMD